MPGQHKPLFGEEYMNAYAYDENTVQLVRGHVSNPSPSRIERRLETSAAIMKDSSDIKSLCAALRITEMEMLTLQLNGLKNFESLIKFIKDNVTSQTLVCSINIITHEIDVKESHASGNHTKKISKILLGHHILMCIPSENSSRFCNPDNIDNVLMNGIELSPEVLQCFQKEAVALFDYEEIHKKAGTDIIKDSQVYIFGETKSLLAELSEDPPCDETSPVEIGLYLVFIAAGVALFSMAFGRGRK
jgi:hypothetical protein